MNEARAIELCIKHRDPAGFEFLFKQFRREAYYHAISFLSNHDEAIDACQESFCRAYAAMPRLQELKSFYPWFYSILRNHCMNVLRRQGTIHRYINDETENKEKHADLSTPAVLMERSEEHMKTRQTLERLSAEFREILVLKYIEGRSYTDISGLLEIPRGTVMSRLYHARKSFRAHYLKFESQKGGDHGSL